MSFTLATRWPESGDGRYTGVIEEGWYQGRGAFGGLVGAAIVEALIAAADDPSRPVRSCDLHFSAPAQAGPATVHTEIVRRGGRITQGIGKIVQDGAVVTFGTVTLAQPRRETLTYATARAPDVPPPASLAPFEFFAGAPRFLQHYDVRFCFGAPPFSGAAEPKMGAWLRTRVPVEATVPVRLALTDVLPAACCATMTAPRPIASVDLSFTALATDPGPAGAFHLLTIDSRWAGDGYTEERRELWDERGALVAECRQLIALL